MEDWEKMDRPHAVYRLWSAAPRLLYVGCAYRPFGRIGHHFSLQPWYADIATVTIEWHPSLPAARKAEALAIQGERPEHNKLVLQPEQLGQFMLERANKPRRGNGKDCPKCGAPKDKRKDPYCRECLRKYRAAYRQKIILS